MCKYCEQKHNEWIGIECGKVMLDYTNTVITKNKANKYIMSSNDSCIFEINYCPNCGEELK